MVACFLCRKSVEHEDYTEGGKVNLFSRSRFSFAAAGVNLLYKLKPPKLQLSVPPRHTAFAVWRLVQGSFFFFLCSSLGVEGVKYNNVSTQLYLPQDFEASVP